MRIDSLACRLMVRRYSWQTYPDLAVSRFYSKGFCISEGRIDGWVHDECRVLNIFAGKSSWLVGQCMCLGHAKHLPFCTVHKGHGRCLDIGSFIRCHTKPGCLVTCRNIVTSKLHGGVRFPGSFSCFFSFLAILQADLSQVVPANCIVVMALDHGWTMQKDGFAFSQNWSLLARPCMAEKEAQQNYHLEQIFWWVSNGLQLTQAKVQNVDLRMPGLAYQTWDLPQFLQPPYAANSWQSTRIKITVLNRS